jgi:hypothetical protein
MLFWTLWKQINWFYKAIETQFKYQEYYQSKFGCIVPIDLYLFSNTKNLIFNFYMMLVLKLFLRITVEIISITLGDKRVEII